MKILTLKFIIILALIFHVFSDLNLNAAVYDPLGNRIFEGQGEPLYTIDATYGLIDGDAIISRSKKFREALKGASYVTFRLGEPEKMTHLISVGGFHTAFSTFTLNKRQSDSVGWTLLFPRSKGKISAFISKLTGTTISNEDKTIITSSDWYMAGARAEANLGVLDINVSDYMFSFPLPRLGISYVNKYFTNYNLSKTSNPFKGMVEHNPPEYIYLRFSDGSPENADGAKLFRIKVFINKILEYNFIGGQEPPGVLIDSGGSFANVNSRWVDGSEAFIYRFYLPNTSEIDSVNFELDIANDYVVEISNDGQNYRVVLSAEGNITDQSNRKWEKFSYGESIGISTLGLDLSTTLFGIAISVDRSWLLKNWQYPSYRGKRFNDPPAGAWFVDANRRLGPISLAGEYTYIGPFYNASDFIDDDDDGDSYLDGKEPFLPDITTEDDLDGDGIKDWEDDFLLFRRDPPKFRLGLGQQFMDFNNNGEPDDTENDTKPDYRFDYEEGSKGYRTYIMIEAPFLEGLAITPGYYKKMLILDKKSARAWYTIINYIPKEIPNFGTIQLRFLTKRAHDIIPDDLIGRPDNLALQNSLSNIVTMIADYKRVRNLILTTKFKYQYDADFHGKRRVIDTILINQVRYNIPIGSDTVLSPAYRNDKTIGYTKPQESSTSIDAVRQAYILQLTHSITEILKVSAGIQYLTFRDLKNPLQNFNRRVGFFALALNDKIADKNVGIMTSIDYAAHDLSKSIGGSYKNTSITVRLFLL